jgi:CubicO group peptidase (beta-lactamase class C family)
MAALLALAGAAPAAAQPAFDRAAASQAVDGYLRRNGVPGAVVVVTDGDRVLMLQGLGHDGDGGPLSADSRLPICSLSKSFVALAVMQLADQGKVSLDAPAMRYLPEFRLADPRAARITVRQLMAHRSGLSDRTFREKSVTPTPRSLRQAVAALSGAKLAAGPGDRRSYTNPNYWVLARMVEVISGQPFGAYMREHVFLPLGMTRTSVWTAVGDAPDVAKGFVRVLNQPVAMREPAWFLGGACGVVTTANDLGRWLRMQSTGKSPATGAPIVSAAALEAMHDGLGWNSRREASHRRISHNGVMFTYSADQYLLPDIGDGLGIGVIANAGVGLSPLPADDLASLLVSYAEGRTPRVSPPLDLLVDGFLGALAVVVLLAAGWRWRRAPRPRGPWGRLFGVGLALPPILWLGFYPAVLRAALGRDLDWRQSLYATPMLFVLAAVLALVCAIGAVRVLCAKPVLRA